MQLLVRPVTVSSVQVSVFWVTPSYDNFFCLLDFCYSKSAVLDGIAWLLYPHSHLSDIFMSLFMSIILYSIVLVQVCVFIKGNLYENWRTSFERLI